VEEGVDVQACSFVAVFDTLKNTKGYIQMKGRARQKNSKFFVFQDANSTSAKSKLSLKSAQEMEKRVTRFIETHSKQPAPPLADTFCREEVEGEQLHVELAALEAGHYHIECGAVDIQSAKSLLNRYTLSVPLDPFARSSREALLAHMPVYDENTLILPSHLPRRVRLVHIPDSRKNLPKKEKSKMMAFMACVRLHSLGLLNDRLLPLTRKDMQAHVMRVATRELEMVSLRPPAVEKAFCGGDVQLYMYPIQQTSRNFLTFASNFGPKGRCLALVTLEPVEDMPEFKMKHAEFGIVSNSLGKESVITCTAQQRSILSQTFILLMSQRWRKRSRNMGYRMRSKDELSSMVAPYYVGITSSDGQMDWDLMTLLLHESLRSIDERTEAVRRASDTSKLPLPRLWSPIYDQNMSFISYGPSGETCESRFPHEKEGVVTYKDYFEKHRGFDVPACSPLFDAQRLWHLPSNLPISHETSIDPQFAKSAVGPYDVCKELPLVKLAQGACCEAPLANASIALLCSMLPQFLFLYERCILVTGFIEHCIRHIPTLGEHLATLPIEMVATALTAKSCSLDDCYDKLEWFGDSVLKLIQTDTLLKSIELRQWISFLHEGDLSTLRSGTLKRVLCGLPTILLPHLQTIAFCLFTYSHGFER
jgi:dsRNA-specific ribonuclease